MGFNSAFKGLNICHDVVVGRDSSVITATRYSLIGRWIESRWERDFLLPSKPTLGPKRPGRGVGHPPTSSADVKEMVELYLNSHSRSSWPVLGWNLSLPLPWCRQFQTEEVSQTRNIKKSVAKRHFNTELLKALSLIMKYFGKECLTERH